MNGPVSAQASAQASAHTSAHTSVHTSARVSVRAGGLIGRGLLTLANVITVAAPVAADWNDSHIFNERWPAHARFHAVTALAMSTGLSSLNIWSLWGGGDRDTARFFAAAVPVAYWAPFLAAPAVRGAAIEDPPHPVPRLAGVPTNVLGAAATAATAVAGWLIDRRATAIATAALASDQSSRQQAASQPHG